MGNHCCGCDPADKNIFFRAGSGRGETSSMKRRNFHNQYNNFTGFERSGQLATEECLLLNNLNEEKSSDQQLLRSQYFALAKDKNQGQQFDYQNYMRQLSTSQPPQIVKRIVKENIRHVYRMGKLIGSGNFGTVRQAAPLSNPHKVYAIKSIPRERIDHDLKLLEQELQILMEVDHPNIVKFYETYKDSKHYHIVMEYCDGGELFQQVISNGRFNEKDAIVIVKQILSALRHLHDKNIAHRDLKPENIIFESRDIQNLSVKMIDFGLSKLMKGHKEMVTKLGTPYYVSPEVLEGKYDKQCDMWAAGVITYILLSGIPPFNGKNELEVFNKIRCCDFEFPAKYFDEVSAEAKDFISKLFLPSARTRMTPSQALQHPWILSGSREISSAHHTVLNRLRSFKRPKKLQQELLLQLVNQLDPQEIHDSRQTFQAIDQNLSGLINKDDLRHAFSTLETNEQDQSVEDIIGQLDYEKTGEINYSEFLAGTLDQEHLSEDNLWHLFKKFDVFNDNFLTKASIMKNFQRSSKQVKEEDLDNMLKELNIQPNSRITFELFTQIMKGVLIQNP